MVLKLLVYSALMFALLMHNYLYCLNYTMYTLYVLLFIQFVFPIFTETFEEEKKNNNFKRWVLPTPFCVRCGFFGV